MQPSVKVEQVTGLPFLEIKIDKAEIARRGMSLSDVQDVIGIAIGGRAAGLVFEGDRRFQIIVRLADAVRDDVEALGNLPVLLPQAAASIGRSAPLRRLRTSSFGGTEPDQPGERQTARGRDSRSARARHRLAWSMRRKPRWPSEVKLPSGYWLAWGGQFENLRRQRANGC